MKGGLTVEELAARSPVRLRPEAMLGLLAQEARRGNVAQLPDGRWVATDRLVREFSHGFGSVYSPNAKY